MRIEFTKEADADLDYFKRSGNKKVIEKIKALLKSMLNDPYSGIGKPEPLKYNLSGAWSRRISKEHRIVYEIDGDVINVLSLKGHY